MGFSIISLLSLTFLAALGCCLGDRNEGFYGVNGGYGGYYGGYGGYGNGYGGHSSGYGVGKDYGGKDDDKPEKSSHSPYSISPGYPLPVLLGAAHANDSDTAEILYIILGTLFVLALLYNLNNNG